MSDVPKLDVNQLRHMIGDVNKRLREAKFTIAAIGHTEENAQIQAMLADMYSQIEVTEQGMLKAMKTMGIDQDGVTLGYETTDD